MPSPDCQRAQAPLLTPQTRIQRETAEETGFQIRASHKVFEAYMSAGAVTEKLHFFVAEYAATDRSNTGGGLAHEGEDIEVLELKLPHALDMIANGQIQDAKTIMLLQHAAFTRRRQRDYVPVQETPSSKRPPVDLPIPGSPSPQQ